MCRIAGIIDFHQPASLNKIDAMRDSMTHGGPDDGGSYRDTEFPVALAVRRLALIDLSAQGHQPMTTSDEQVWIAFNGELYNYRELKSTLISLGHVFYSGTDTEVVLLAWRQWGRACFNRFNGMFGLCIWDKQARQLLLARDHAGMKPVYYFLDPVKKQLYFASEVRAFKTIRPNWPDDPGWRVNLLGYGHMPEPRTTLEHVVSLPKGSFLQVDLPSFKTVVTRWYYPPSVYNTLNKEDAQRLLREKLDLAVQQHLVADASVGLFLSGGIDSSILTILAAKHIPANLLTLSITFDEAAFSEKKYQDIIINKVQCSHRSFNVSRKEFECSMPDILEAMDQPSNDGINSYLISKYARQSGLKAVLSGIGADEIFGGYGTFNRHQTARALRRLPNWMLGMAAGINDDRIKRISYLQYKGRSAEYLFHRGFYTPEQIAMLLNMNEREVCDILIRDRWEARDEPASANEYVSGLEEDFYMQNQLLRDTDYMSMWHSVEIRMPFLDRNLLDFCKQTQPTIRFEPGIPKKWLVDAFKDLLPEEIWNRKKMGFIFPFKTWFKSVTVAGASDARFYQVERRFKQGKLQWSRYWAWLLCMQAAIRFTPATKKILFVTLKTFSFVGGIEKFNRVFSMALQENAVENNWQVCVLSLWDDKADERYLPAFGYRGFNRNVGSFARAFFKVMGDYDVVIAGHINLSAFFLLTRLRRSKPKLLLIAHGIEVWQPLSYLQKQFLKICNAVWCVSRFTAQTVVEVNQLPATKTRLFPNTIDPYFMGSAVQPSTEALRVRYAIPPGFKIIVTITRLASTEKYKGYDEVLRVLPSVLQKHPDTRYLLCGKADAAEESRIKDIIKELNLQQAVVLTGFVPDEELKAHYLMADTFVMPSRKEGFGIVFIEAAWLGLQVIGGNVDGSVDALLNGDLGTLVTPGNQPELEAAIVKTLDFAPLLRKERRQLVEDNFGFEAFKNRQLNLLGEW